MIKDISRTDADDGKYVRGEKRQRLPFIIEWECESCGETWKHDYSRDTYFSFPAFGKTNKEVLYCKECGYENEVDIRLDVTLDVEKR